MDYNQEQKQDRKTLLWAALAVLLLLNLVLVYFIYHEKQENLAKDEIITAKTEEVLSIKTKLDSISEELDVKIAEIQKLGGSVDSLIALKAELEKDKKELKNANTYSAANYNKKIKNYESVLSEKDGEIAKLKQELGIAASKNEELNQKVTGLESEKQQLADSVVNYSVQNKELSEKVNIASALRAESLTVNAVSAKGKEREGGKYKAKRIDKLRVNFKLGENAVAKQNEKEIFLRILDPDGAVLSDMATGSGSFMVNGKELIYSSKQSVTFNNTGQSVDIFYGRGGIPLKDGKYAIEVYSEGFKIGQGDFTVK
jgi:myosin heavy subunit